jgi:hypothetical protein
LRRAAGEFTYAGIDFILESRLRWNRENLDALMLKASADLFAAQAIILEKKAKNGESGKSALGSPTLRQISKIRFKPYMYILQTAGLL